MVTADYGPEVEIQAFLQMCNIKDQKAGVFGIFCCNTQQRVIMIIISVQKALIIVKLNTKLVQGHFTVIWCSLQSTVKSVETRSK